MANRDTKLKIVVDAENRTQGAFNELKRNLDGIRQSHEGLISAMRTVGTMGAVAFGGLAFLSKGIIGAGAGFEQTSIAFETMIGNAELAKKTLHDLAQFAARTPFELTQLEEASKRLLAYGLTAEELLPTLEMLGDISAGVGMDKLPQLILAFGQVRAATKLTGMELRQFSEAGVPLLGTLAQQLGKTEAEVIEMVSAGQIGFPQVQQALASLTAEGGRFNDLMIRQSQSLGGLWSNFKDQLSLTARAIGEELLPYLKPLTEELIKIAQHVGAFVKQHPQLAAILLVAILGFTALLALLLPLAIVLPGLILIFTGFGAAIAFVTAMSAPLLLVIGTVIAILVALAAQGYLTKDAWEEVWLGIKLFAADAANAVIGSVEAMVNFIINGVNFAIRAINKVISLAQKVPGFGKKLSTISELGAADFGRVDTNLIAANALSGSQRAGPTIPANLIFQGNTFLSQESAEQIGDLIMKRLKLSNAI